MDLIVFIEDLIRDERVRVRLDVDTPVDAIVGKLVEQFGLPRRDFDLSRIQCSRHPHLWTKIATVMA